MAKRLHAVVCAYPALGHINPLLRLSTLLLQQGVRVTFVTTQFFCDRLRQQQTVGTRLVAEGEGGNQQRQGQETIVVTEDELATRQLPNNEGGRGEEVEGLEGFICLEGLPDGLPAEFDRISPSTELVRAVDQLHPAFEKLLCRVLQSTSPAPSLLIADAFLPWTQDVARALRMPGVIFWPQSVAVFTIFGHTDHLLKKGFNPFSDNLDTAPAPVIDFLPGLPSLPTSHLPHHVKSVEGQDRRFLLYENLTKQFQQFSEASCIFINSLESLESLPIKVLQSKIEIPVWLVGPLVSLPYTKGQPSESVPAEDFEDVLEWLNRKAAASVLYICLGSVVSWTKRQVEEVGLGLLEKQQAFLWVVRPWEMKQVLPHGLLKLGKVAKFVPQVQVLGHPAIGGFLSHCGWNSTLESLSMGVPILAWPHFLDQFTNCWYVVNVWKVGVELGLVRRGDVQEAFADRDQFARAAALLMDAENGQLLRSWVWSNPGARVHIQQIRHEQLVKSRLPVKYFSWSSSWKMQTAGLGLLSNVYFVWKEMIVWALTPS
ncbi:hypothetical protein GOP47_0004381 [Adiantum capillus-veneris]|uniref:Glycosyltransferase n=1 Tax=Adiantum capillus-veneris TaxID=13818 RepID=A0A9D4V8R9_ADICA|nr:hypothetical protein GOP47_0004381 [Adiantum capillus-veneris]